MKKIEIIKEMNKMLKNEMVEKKVISEANNMIADQYVGNNLALMMVVTRNYGKYRTRVFVSEDETKQPKYILETALNQLREL